MGRGIPLDRREWRVDPTRVTEFWRLVDQAGDDDCWTWTGYCDSDGYGLFVIEGKKYGAHELALSFTTGERRLPELDTCHSCDNPTCCNPRHLRFDTRLSNVQEMHTRGRASRPRRLSDADVRLIRQRRAAGAPQQLLAEQFGVGDGYISTIVRGLVRRDAGGPIQQSMSRKGISA